MTTQPARPASWVRPYAEPPLTDIDPGTKSWICRGANFVIVLSDVEEGAILSRDNADEYMLLTAGPAVAIEAGGERLEAAPQTVTIVPPGPSKAVALGAGPVVRVFTKEAADLAARAGNADAYADPTPDVAPLTLWPMPEGGYKLRNYLLADYIREGSNMRIFRSRGLMLNVTTVREQPRDTSKLTPHSHADFEQGSLTLSGNYIHHLRYPWSPDMADWREDQHIDLQSPSMLVITPTTIHTSRNCGEEPGWLIDVFAPPRVDFSLREGLVANAAEYPLPAEVIDSR